MLATHFNPWAWVSLCLVALGFFCFLVVQLAQGWADRQEWRTIRKFEGISNTVHEYSEEGEAEEQQRLVWHAQMLKMEAEQREEDYRRHQQAEWEEENHMDGSPEPWLDPLHPWYEGH